MFKRLRLALVAAALALTSIVPSLSPVAAVGEQACNQEFHSNFHNGITVNPYNFTTVRGVRAILWSQSRIAMCTNPDGIHSAGPSYWVAIVPAPGNPQYGNANAILQIGVNQCIQQFTPVCDGQKRLFFAIGGCGGIIPYTPTPQNLLTGPTLAPSSDIDFRIFRNSGGASWTLWWNAITAGKSGSFGVSSSDEALSCWITGNVSAQYDCERWDHGDACGSPGVGTYVAFRDMRFQKSQDGSWLYPGQVVSGVQYGFSLADSSCTQTLAEDDCNVRQDLESVPGKPDDFDTWTSN